MKKILIVMLAALMTVALVGCSTAGAPATTDDQDRTEQADADENGDAIDPDTLEDEQDAAEQPQDGAEDTSEYTGDEGITVPEGYEPIIIKEKIVGLMLMIPEDEINQEWSADFYVELTEQEAIDKTIALLEEASAEFRTKGVEAYQVKAEQTPVDDPAVEQYPTWSITLDEIDDQDILRSSILSEIDMRGRVASILFNNVDNTTTPKDTQDDDNTDTNEPDATDNLIDDEHAIDIAIETLVENDILLDPDVYGAPTAQKREWDGKIVYDVTCAPMDGMEPSEDSGLLHYHEYYVQIDAATGEVISWDQCA